jgi:hypothetical protein
MGKRSKRLAAKRRQQQQAQSRQAKEARQTKVVAAMKEVLAPPTPQYDTPLNFPFVDVDGAAIFLGDIPNMDEVAKACPDEFRNYRNKWTKLAAHMFFSGYDLRTLKWHNPALKNRQLAYFKCWLSSFAPKHEVKEAVCGWLLSLMLLECPEVR